MKVTYDAETNVLTIELRGGPISESDEERSGVILDYDAEGRLVAIEVMEASTRVDGVDVVQLRVVPKPSAEAPKAAE
jgi:YD repeat-containing protein